MPPSLPEEEDLDAQIAALQAKKAARDAKLAREVAHREAEARKVLVGATPTKKVGGVQQDIGSPSRSPKPFIPENLDKKGAIPASTFYGSSSSKPRPPRQSLPTAPSFSSKMSTGLATMRRNPSLTSADLIRKTLPARSTSFSNRPHQPDSSTSAGPSRMSAQLQAKSSKGKERFDDELEIDDSAPRRDMDTLEIMEKLKLGPGVFGKDPEGEDVWAFLEPNSGIRLSKRVLAHSELQDFLFGRYYLSPSQLYSVIRLSRDSATYDVPVEGDWITMAVVAERGEVRVSGSKSVGPGEDDDGSSSEEEEHGAQALIKEKSTEIKPKFSSKWKKRDNQEDEKLKKRRPTKYINLKLVALPPRNYRSNKSGETSTSSGDAILQLLLFESDHVVSKGESDGADEEDGERKVMYKGGSGGAYERWCTLKEGDVIALLNARVLRPLKAGKAAPHPLTLPLALNPLDGDSIILIGQSRDMGCCSAQMRDGNRCKAWVDLRQGAVCEYHISQALQRGRAGRAEFSTATTSFMGQSRPSGSSGNGNSMAFGGKKSEGLLPRSGRNAAPRGPDNGGGGATYVFGTKTISTRGGEEGHHRTPGSLNHFGTEHLEEKLGRGRAEKRKRQKEEKETEEVLKRLVDVRSTGGKYLRAIENPTHSGSDGKDQSTKKAKTAGDDGEESKGEDKERTFSASMIQKIGFDPHRIGMSEAEKQARAESIRKLKVTGKGFDGRVKIRRQNVRAPPNSQNLQGRSSAKAATPGLEWVDGDGDMIDLG